ncbi:MAG TPA: glycosyltransferase [Nevskiaceae bacterium]|nr:glycosyltransferase [Nevskiaceae bacterium]
MNDSLTGGNWLELEPQWWTRRREHAADLDVQLAFAQTFRLRGDLAAAIDAVRAAQSLAPADERVLEEFVSCYEASWAWRNAIAGLSQWLARSPRRADLRVRMGKALAALGRHAEAAGFFESALELSPRSGELHRQRALFLEAQGHVQRAARALASADVKDASGAFRDERIRIVARALNELGAEYTDPKLKDVLIADVLADSAKLAPARFWDAIDVCLELDDRASVAKLASSIASLPAVAERNAALIRFCWRLAARVLTNELDTFRTRFSGEAMHAVGVALELRGEESLAMLAFVIASALEPTHQGYAMNAGMCLLRAGVPTAAARFFAKVERAYDKHTRTILWPQRDGVRWPHTSHVDAPAFDAQLPRGKKWPRITIVSPSFNQAQYVEETLLSVLNQGYPNLQYIVVDGGSTDGTLQILKRYQARLSKLIVGPDRGQTDAINKGMRFATGEILGWLNTDDLLAPGALHQIALRYLQGGVDVIAGACLTHRSGRFEIANLPAVTQKTFTPAMLAEIFDYWMRGYFFYQPEVFFTRKLFKRVGGKLRTDLHYSMDYELWLRFAKARARFGKVAWPVAFFRHHALQKTSALVACVCEQAELRNRAQDYGPGATRISDLRRRLRAKLGKDRARIVVHSGRHEKIFSPTTQADLWAAFAGTPFELTFVGDDAAIPADTDIVIWLVHLLDDEARLERFRKRVPNAIVVGWFWDNHHHLFENHAAARRVDFIVPGHAFAAGYLANREAVMVDSVPLCVTQWSASEAQAAWAEAGDQSRSDDLYGGFVWYAFAEKRNRLVEQLVAAGEKHVYLMDESDLSRYFARSRPERFREWASFKTSLCLPLYEDISQRFFDALLAGQIPIVPEAVPDLSSIVSKAQRASLPIVTFDAMTVDSVRKAHRRAIALFDKLGAKGAQRRHRYALEHAMLAPRIGEMLSMLGNWARRR